MAENKTTSISPAAKDDLARVAAGLAVLMTAAKCLMLLIPFAAASWLTPEKSEIMVKIVTDQNFDIVWVMIIGFLIGKKSSEK